LTEKEHWDSVHESEEEHLDSPANNRGFDYEQLSLMRKLVVGVKKLLGPNVLVRMSSYGDYLLWDVIFQQHLPKLKGAKVLEVGSSPGEFLVQFSQKYECVPYGVDYSEVGVQLNRKTFSSHGINPDNVIHADFFSDQFQERYQESFDVVISRGFIEHFMTLKM
jgi:2-polyprenyl-3-methyl-5-hydroxy-6-metoxy-1,4-benzoquinol methylase